MTRLDAFDSFYRASRHRILAVNYALSGDLKAAHKVSVDAYARTWRQWNRLRGRDLAAYTRAEAYKHVLVARGTHLLLKRSDDDIDNELIEALSSLGNNERRMISLLTVGGIDLDAAASEMAINDQEAMETASRALRQLEDALGVPIGELEPRMDSLYTALRDTTFPPANEVRRKARRESRRNAVTLVAVATATVVAGGLLSTQGGALERRAELPYREKLGAERPDIVLQTQQLSTDDLLSLEQVGQLDATASWSIDGTDTDPENVTPYSTCPTTRYADPDPLKVLVQAYSTTDDSARVAQSIEVSLSEEASEAAYAQLISWYANCIHPRVRLIDAYTVRRPFGDFQILRLQSYRSPARFISVGIAQSGAVTSTLVHEQSGSEPTDVNVFAQALNDSIERVCADSGGECTTDIEVLPAPPPRTIEDPAFLSVIDMPPLGDIDEVWTPGEALTTTMNPAASLCDKTMFPEDEFTNPRSKLFVLPNVPELPREFAIAQTTAAAPNAQTADQVINAIAGRVAACSESELSATVEDNVVIEDPEFVGHTWRLSFEVSEDEFVTYRMGVVRRENMIAQVLFPPAGTADLNPGDFTAMMERAGERLRYSDDLIAN